MADDASPDGSAAALPALPAVGKSAPYLTGGRDAGNQPAAAKAPSAAPTTAAGSFMSGFSDKAF